MAKIRVIKIICDIQVKFFFFGFCTHSLQIVRSITVDEAFLKLLLFRETKVKELLAVFCNFT
jgi:hypothetical protein